MLDFTGERIVPEADNCEPTFASKMYHEHVARYFFASQLVRGRSVLDVGCGVGYGSKTLIERGAASVLAFDLSDASISHARQFYGAPGLEFRTGDATDFDFGRRFDVVTCFELIEHVDDQDGVFRSIARHLAPGGLVVVSTPRALETKRTDFHAHEYSYEEFRATFERHFARHAFYFENNHFSSLITDRRPGTLGRVEPIKDQFHLGMADYFIVVAAQSGSVTIDGLDPVLTLDDDRYVRTLEHDVSVLRRAESALLEGESVLRSEVSRIERQSDAFEKERDRLAAEVEALGAKLVEARELLESAALQTEDVKQQVTALETRARLAERECDYLRSVEQEILSSLSWRVSAPVRVIGRPVRRAQRLVDRVIDFRSRFGDRALLAAVKRRMIGAGAAPSPLLAQSADPTSAATADIQPVRPRSIDPADVLMLIGCWDGESKRYRVYNIAAALRARGLTVGVIPFSEVGRLADDEVKASVVVLFRAPFEESLGVTRFLDYARRRSIKVVFDIDDLVFDPTIVDAIHGYKRLTPALQAQYLDGVERYRKLLLACDAVTVTTPLLLREVEKLGKPGFVVPNTVNLEQVRLARSLLERPASERAGVTIAYFSGSRTHERDFAQAEPALLRLMVEHPELRMRVVGLLDLGPAWVAFGDRVERRPFMPYLRMLECLADVDINIAPLEVGDPFCEAKSELKFFEASLVGVPTVASATEPMRLAIESGRTGLLASDVDAWYAALKRLVTDAGLRETIGTAARGVALERFGMQAAASTALAAYGLSAPAALSAAAPASAGSAAALTTSARLRIDWIIPGLLIGGGGHRNILRAAYHLERFGHDVTLYFTQTDKTAEELRTLLHAHFYPFMGGVRRVDGHFRPADVLMATHWSTVDVALSAREQVREVMYFVQDFEPAFAPMGSEYVLAENTYRHGLYCVTSGPWCEVFLKANYGVQADHFKFPIDRDVYYPRPRTRADHNIVFFAKPEMPRRCFEIGAMALREVKAARPEVDILMFGSGQVRKQGLDYPVSVLDVVPTIDDLANMYSNADIGVVFSTTNPSLVPYEMMACGLPVVDLGRPGNEVNYAGRHDIALLADPMPSLMARQILALLDDTDDRARRSAEGLAFAATFPTEEEMARRVESLIVARLRAGMELSA
jgi:glycosyltransferase involved in cell wall biosynthesis/SAM-dependent methyltransferase